MATPIGHALAGISIPSFAGLTRAQAPKLVYLVAMSAALAPDLDFIPGVLRGTPALYHQGITHSLGFAVVVSTLAGAALRLSGGWTFLWGAVIVFLSYTSHLGLDLLAVDHRPPIGIPVFWPISSIPWQSPVPLLMGVHHAASTSASTSEWIAAIFSWHNVVAVAVEALVVGTLYTLLRPVLVRLARWFGPKPGAPRVTP